MSGGQAGQRIDKWLWHARFVKTRSLAQKLVSGGNVRVDREKVTAASKTVRPGNTLTLTLARQVKIVEILQLADRRGPYSEACLLYNDLTPVVEKQSSDDKPVFDGSPQKETRPDKHQRRKAIKLKQNYPD